MKNKFWAAAVLLMFFCYNAADAQIYSVEDEDDIPYLTDEDMASLEGGDEDILAYEPLDEEDYGGLGSTYTPDETASEMARLNASQPVYYLLILDRMRSPLNSDISGTDSLSVLYKYKHGGNGYLIALYKASGGGPVFPKLPDKSQVQAGFMSVRINPIREYIRSNAFKRFVTNKKVLSQMEAVLRVEKPGSFQKAAPVAYANEMPRLNTSLPVYHLLILDRLRSPLNSDIGDTGNIQVLYKYKHGRNGYIVVLYKSTADGPVFPQLPEKSRVLADLMSVRPGMLRRYVNSNAFRKSVTNSAIITDIDAILLRER